MRIGRLLFPALRWSAEHGFDHERAAVEGGLELGVGGFILFGGEAAAVRELTAELHERSASPLLIGADLERGAGQQFDGATRLPPVAALGALDEPETTRLAARLTAREARALGVNWVYAPMADVDLEPRNPIVGTRSFGGDPARVAAHVAAFVEGCREAGGLSCAKHFPGHGRTVTDSHIELPTVDADRQALEVDLKPFRAAIDAGVESMMTAHVAYPGLDPSGAAATLSRPIITELLRDELGYAGLVVTDALIMQGVVDAGAGEARAAELALAAGCDALLYPQDAAAVAEAVAEAVRDGQLEPGRIEAAIRRIDDAAARVAGAGGGAWGRPEDAEWALGLAGRAVGVARGRPSAPQDAEVELVVVDDDVGGPYPPGPRDAFPGALRAGGLRVVAVGEPTGERPALIALYSDIRAWKGRPGVSEPARGAVAAALEARPDATVVLFAHPRLADDVPGRHVLAAWGGEPIMEEAAARWLTGAGR